MTDTEKLKGKIRASGLRFGYVAEQIGLTPAGFYKKMQNVTEFKASEIQKLCDILKIDDRERSSIFFASVVDK